jgi:hypothetical protein
MLLSKVEDCIIVIKSRLKKIFIFLGIASLVSLALQSEELMNYEVKENDNLSKILYRYKLFPIYGEDGFIKKVIELNKDKMRKNGNLIRKGIVIVLPMKVLEQVSERSIANVEEPVAFLEAEKEVPLEVMPEEIPEVEPTNGFRSKFLQYSFFTLAPRAGYIAINSVDNINLGGVDVSNTTKSAIGLRGEWRVMVRPQFSLFAFTNVDKVNFYNDSNYSLSNTNFTRASFGIGEEYGLDSLTTIETSILTNQNYFLEVITPSEVQIRQLSQIELHGRYLKNFLKIDRVSSTWGVGGMVMLPASRENYKASLGYGLSLDWTTKFLTNEFQLSYLQKFYKINNMNNQSKELLLNFNFQFARKE